MADLKPIESIVRSVRAIKRELTHPHSSSTSPKKPKKEFRRPRLGLALGGGFAREKEHIGVLKVLEEANLKPDFIAGTSVGSVIGATYCSGISARELTEIAGLIRFKDFARYCVSKLGLCCNDRMTQLLKRVCKVHTFEELHTPLAVIATDFLTGEAVVLRKGNLIDPVRASCAYPGIFTPVNVNGRLMVDGMLAHCVPAIPVREMGAEKIISVSFNAHWVKTGAPRHVLDIIGQCFSIVTANMDGIWQAVTDVSIVPDVAEFAYDAFEKAPKLIEAGMRAAEAALPQIQAMMQAPAEETVEAMDAIPMNAALSGMGD